MTRSVRRVGHMWWPELTWPKRRCTAPTILPKSYVHPESSGVWPCDEFAPWSDGDGMAFCSEHAAARGFVRLGGGAVSAAMTRLTASQAAKIASLLDHVAEAISVKGHGFDIEAARALLDDPDVQEWLATVPDVMRPVRR